MHKNHYQVLKNIHDPNASLAFLKSKCWNKIEPIYYEDFKVICKYQTLSSSGLKYICSQKMKQFWACSAYVVNDVKQWIQNICAQCMYKGCLPRPRHLTHLRLLPVCICHSALWGLCFCCDLLYMGSKHRHSNNKSLWKKMSKLKQLWKGLDKIRIVLWYKWQKKIIT